MEYPIHVRDLNIRDVCILPYEKEGTYFTYQCAARPDRDGRMIVCRESKDLVWWSESYPAFACDEDFWGPMDHWAPECHEYKGKYYLVSSFRAKGGYRGCQFLVADTPRGPFVPMVNHPATPEGWHCLDGTLYIDKKGDPWMVFCHEWVQVQDGQMCAIRMKDDLSESIGDPIILFRAGEAPWKFTDDRECWRFTQPQPKIGYARITDGCYMYRAENGDLLMLWSSFSNTGYTCTYAKSVSGEIEGPWVQQVDPMFSQDGGHSMLFKALDGRLIMSLHSPNIGGKERMLLFELEDKNGHLKIVNELTGNWIPNKYYEDGSDKGQG